MEYRDLATLYHMDSSSARDKHAAELLEQRLTSPSTFDLDISLGGNALFVAVPRELSALNQRVLERERKITKLMQALPGLAGSEVLRSLVIDEVVMSNNIENIHSTRAQIEHALSASNTEKPQIKRFREFAKLYIELSYGKYSRPETVEDIRMIYDKIMDNEHIEYPPDGKLFRKDPVSISNGLKAVHQGITPESEIIKSLNAMLKLVDSREIPELYSALASHFIFEYIHPFYDGNGRLGRYLLSLFLERPLSKPTALSLSRVMAENRNAYYHAFQIAEDPLNHGELTFFVMSMHELILKAQNELIDRLEKNVSSLGELRNAVNAISQSKQFTEKEIEIIYLLAQQAVFGISPDADLDALALVVDRGTQQTRKYLAALEKRHVVRKIRGRDPITFALEPSFLEESLRVTSSIPT